MVSCRSVAFVLLVGLLFRPALPGHAQVREAADRSGADPAKEAARTAVQEWLGHVDSGAWSTAWNEAGSLLQEAMPIERWESRGAQARRTLGALRSRRLVRAERRDTLRQTSESGPFVLLRYRSAFEAGLYAETVLTAKTGDSWTVAGYEVAPIVTTSDQRPTGPRRHERN